MKFFDGPVAHRVTPGAGEQIIGLNFGNRALPGEIHGQKFHDFNSNGINDVGEPGLEGWTIYLDANDNGQLDEGEVSTTTDANGNYAFTGLEPLQNYIVRTVQESSWTRITPSDEFVVSLGAGEVVVDRDFGSGLTISVDDIVVDPEGNDTSTVTFTVTLSAASSVTTTVEYATADGTAKAGKDYEATNGTLTFDPGETEKVITVTINGDATDEFDETFVVVLSNSDNAEIVDVQGEATIHDDDALVTVSISDAVLNAEGDIGTRQMIFTVSLSVASEKPITVDFTTSDDTAHDSSDYAATSGTLSFAVGETEKTIAVMIRGDMQFETNETFVVSLSSPVNTTVDDGEAIGTITNDDPLLTVNSTADKPDLTPGNFTVDTGIANEITLRAAIMEANALSGPDTIILPAGTYVLTESGINEDDAALGDLDITADELTIVGDGAATTIIDASGLSTQSRDRVFHILSAQPCT